jgi:hypothetical protein
LANEEDSLASHAPRVLEAEREGDLLGGRLRAAESAQAELRD